MQPEPSVEASGPVKGVSYADGDVRACAAQPPCHHQALSLGPQGAEPPKSHFTAVQVSWRKIRQQPPVRPPWTLSPPPVRPPWTSSACPRRRYCYRGRGRTWTHWELHNILATAGLRVGPSHGSVGDATPPGTTGEGCAGPAELVVRCRTVTNTMIVLHHRCVALPLMCACCACASCRFGASAPSLLLRSMMACCRKQKIHTTSSGLHHPLFLQAHCSLQVQRSPFAVHA